MAKTKAQAAAAEKRERDKEYDKTQRSTAIMRVSGETHEKVKAIAAVEKRNAIDQLDIIVDAGMKALGFKTPRKRSSRPGPKSGHQVNKGKS